MRVRLARGSIASVSLALALILDQAACVREEVRGEPPGMNILLITIDTLRADRLGSYGYNLATSPHMDRLAGRGVRFVDCTVQWPKTWPSMASLLTGAYPKTIGMKYRHLVLDPQLLLLSEVFQEAGYRTGAVVANFNIGKASGFNQGFDAFVESWQEVWAAEAGDEPFVNRPGKVKRYTDARIVTDQGLRWLRAEDDRPFFLWLHYMDPHGPYIPPVEYGAFFQGAHPYEPVPLEKLPRYQLQVEAGKTQPVTDLGFYRAQYDREVRFLDDELGRLFAELDRMGVDRSNTLIILSADHGESFNEHEYYLEHGQFSYQACARVPLILALEGRLPPGRVVEEPVGLLDLSATILDLAGLAIPATFEGRSLGPLMVRGNPGDAPDYVFMEAGYRRPTQLSVRQGDWKLILVRSSEDRKLLTGEEAELYDVRSDPDELHNLASRYPEMVARLKEVVLDWYSSGPRGAESGEELDLRSLSPKEREMLRSLGYVR